MVAKLSLSLTLQHIVGGNPPATLVIHIRSAMLAVITAITLLLVGAIGLYSEFKPLPVEHPRLVTVAPAEALRLSHSCTDITQYGEHGLHITKVFAVGDFYVRRPMMSSDILNSLSETACHPWHKSGAQPTMIVREDLREEGEELRMYCHSHATTAGRPELVVKTSYSLSTVCEHRLFGTIRSLYEELRFGETTLESPRMVGIYCGYTSQQQNRFDLNLYFEWPFRRDTHPVVRKYLAYDCATKSLYTSSIVVDCDESRTRGLAPEECTQGVFEVPITTVQTLGCTDADVPDPYNADNDCETLMRMAGEDFAARQCPEKDLVDVLMLHVEDDSTAKYVASLYIGACPKTCGHCSIEEEQTVCSDSSNPHPYNPDFECENLLSIPGFTERNCPYKEGLDIVMQDGYDEATASEIVLALDGSCRKTCRLCRPKVYVNVTFVETFVSDWATYHSLGVQHQLGALCTSEESVPFQDHVGEFFFTDYGSGGPERHFAVHDESSTFEFQCVDKDEPSFLARISYIWPWLSLMQSAAMLYLVKLLYKIFYEAHIRMQPASATAAFAKEARDEGDKPTDVAPEGGIKALAHALNGTSISSETLQKLLQSSMKEIELARQCDEGRHWKAHAFNQIDKPICPGLPSLHRRLGM